MIVVDRAEFMAWLDGVALDFKRGRGIAPNERACQAAYDASQRGERIGFTIKNRLVTTAKSKDGVICEEVAK